MDFDSAARLVLMALGIGAVIFVHELGHFVAARLCKVRVEVFSLGFGPKLLGWKRGATQYQLAALPIGGFVRMAGEDAQHERRAAQPDELGSKSVGQRFFIYSGGVLMNVVFALLVLPLVLFSGVPFNEPTIGAIDPGSPAWHARLEPGTRIVSVNGAPITSFEFIASEIALGPPEDTELQIVPPGQSTPRTAHVKPRYVEAAGMQMIGIGPAPDAAGTIEVAPGSAAARAGLESGDRILAVEGPLPELPLTDQLDFAIDRSRALALTVQREGEPPRRVEVVPGATDGARPKILGIKPAADVVADLRDNADVLATGLARGDVIVRVNGRRIAHARDLELALLASQAPVEVVVDRAGARVTLAGPALDRARALAFAADVALGFNTEQREIALHEGSAAAASGLRDGDRLVLVDGSPVPDWKTFLELAGDATRVGRTARLLIEREDEQGERARHEFVVTPAPVAAYGFDLRQAMYTYRAESLGEAIRVGVQGTWKFVVDAWTTVKRMLLGQVSSKNMGGIITIGVVSYSWAAYGIAKLLFFLCLVSVQLAFINVLPVPLLDGGHLFFLLIEKLKGSPVSERVFGYSQMVGLVLILSLVIYVTFQDVVRWGVIDKIFGP